jgi:quercetin dioxygenase-like cupin family protein/mannose-6-phosphate isomerase-like protein (cupin superfamily)
MPESASLRIESSPDQDHLAAEIARVGFSSAVALLSAAECAMLQRHFDDPDLPPPVAWTKGRAVSDPVIHEIASRPDIIALLRPILGDDIVLWGAHLVQRPLGTIHPWHTDMESAAPDARVISLWIGIQNASQDAGMVFISGSHRFRRSVQEVLAGLNEERNTISDARLLEIARSLDPSAQLLQPAIGDGDAVLFDGHVWHSGRNQGPAEMRLALLLQFASVDTPIPIPTGPGYQWPFTFVAGVRAPAILVSGSGERSANLLVPPPPKPLLNEPMVTTLARTIPLPLAEDEVKRWRPYRQFRGPTATFTAMTCHISVLSPGHNPHPPHIHREEELLIVLDGDLQIELADDPACTNSRRHPMKPGMFSYYPTTQHHTIHNIGTRPATYLMFKWSAPAAATESPMAASIFEHEAQIDALEPAPIAKRVLFEQATQLLGQLHAHLTTLQPGAGYDAHADPYDVAIVLFSGEVETVGERVRPLGLIYYSAGEVHGMRNVGTTPASYLVFEFHSPGTVALRQRKLEERRQAREAERERRRLEREHLRAERQQLRAERQRSRAERQQLRAERERRKLEKQRRKRGLRGLLRKLRKLVKEIAR